MNAKAIAAILGAAIIAGIVTHLAEQKRLAAAETGYRASLAQQQEQANAARNQSTLALNARDLEIAGLRKDVNELPRLRNEITRLRREKESNAPQLRRDPTTVTGAAPATVGAIEPGKYIPREQLAFAGYATPEATIQSMMRAVVSGNFEVLTNSYHPSVHAAKVREGRSLDPVLERARFEAAAATNSRLFKGLQILAQKDVRDDSVELKVMVEGDPSAGPNAGQRTNVLSVIREGDEWKFVGDLKKGADWEHTGTIQKFVP